MWTLTKDDQQKNTQLLDKLRHLEAENAELKQSNRIFMSGPVVVFKWQNAVGWPVKYVTDNVIDIFGYTAEELCSGELLYAELIAAADIERVRAVCESTRSNKKIEGTYIEYRIIHKDGSQR